VKELGLDHIGILCGQKCFQIIREHVVSVSLHCKYSHI